MAIITTRNYQNPKPVRGIDYAGQPMPDDGFYNGRPEHQSPDAERREKAPRTSVKASPTRRKRVSATMSPEKRKAFGDRMRAYWQKKRGLPSVAQGESHRSVDTQSSVQPSQSPSVSTGDA